MTVRSFLRLLYKEWRDHRTLILVWACLAPILSQMAQWAFLDQSVYGAEITGRWVLPALALFFLTALAAELVARESVTGAGDSLGRLPVATGLLWFTKLVLLVSVGILSMSWLLVVEAAWRACLDQPVALVLEAFRGASIAHLGLVAGIPLVFACGILVRNGFGAAILGLGVIYGSAFLLSPAVDHEWGARLVAALSLWRPAWLAAVISVAALLASRLAYRPWRGGRGDGRRRCVLFGTGLVLVLAPAGFAAVRRYRNAITLAFHDPQVYIDGFFVSPDQQLVALWVRKDFRGWLPWEARPRTFETWVLNMTDGTLMRTPHSRGVVLPTGYDTASPWTADGELWIHDFEDYHYALWDPRTDIARQVPEPPRDRRWWSIRWSAGGYRFTWRERELEVLFPKTGYLPRASPEPGVVFTVDEHGRLLRHSLLEDAPRVLAEGFTTSGWLSVSPDCRRLSVQANGRFPVLQYRDPETGALLTEMTGWHHRAWTGREDFWARCTRTVKLEDRTHRSSTLLVGDAGLREMDLDALDLHILDPERILMLDRFRGQRLLLVDGEGNTLRTLYGPEE